MSDNNRLEQAAALILREAGVIANDERYDPPFEDTPRRFKEALRELLIGHTIEAPELRVFDYSGPPQLVASYDNQAYCLCPHHLLAVELTVSVGYVAGENGLRASSSKILGLSKLPRLIRWAASRLITQEELANDLLQRISTATTSENVFVHIKGSHSCMRARGIKTRGTVDVYLEKCPGGIWTEHFLRGLP